MTAYAVAHLQPPARLDDEVFAYMERIQATMEPYGGRFLVHGANVEVVEGDWPGALVIVAFPGMREAREWYASDAYRALIPLRTRHMPGDIVLAEGVGPDYDAAGTAAHLRRAQGTPAA